MRMTWGLNIIQQLDHPNILKIYDIFGDQDSFEQIEPQKLMVVQELCTGGSLYNEMMRRNKLRESKAVKIMT